MRAPVAPRVSVPYAEREVRAVYVPGQIEVDKPVAGFFKMKLGRDTIAVGIELRFGQPLDPITGELMDRSLRWFAFADGEPIDFDRVFPACAKTPISAAEYRAMIERKAWARQHAPDSAFAEMGRKYDPLDSRQPLPF